MNSSTEGGSAASALFILEYLVDSSLSLPVLSGYCSCRVQERKVTLTPHPLSLILELLNVD